MVTAYRILLTHQHQTDRFVDASTSWGFDPWNVATTIRFESDWKCRDGANSAVLGIRRHGCARCGRCARAVRRARAGPDRGAGRRYQSHRLEDHAGLHARDDPVDAARGPGVG